MRILKILITAKLIGLGAGSLSAADVEWGDGVKILLIGGGTHHDYQKWFNEYDSELLEKTGRFSARYLEPQELTPANVESADVLVISANKPFPDPAVRKAVFAHVERGEGTVLFHPGLWYSWSDWPEYNRVLAGGGARGHDSYGEFEVNVTSPDHPVLNGVPDSFSITDELYWYEYDEEGTPIEVLATAHSARKSATYPQVFVIKHANARVIGLTLGHDGKAHELPAFQTLFVNACDWVSGE